MMAQPKNTMMLCPSGLRRSYIIFFLYAFYCQIINFKIIFQRQHFGLKYIRGCEVSDIIGEDGNLICNLKISFTFMILNYNFFRQAD